MSVHTKAVEGFSLQASNYDAHRPRYPETTLDVVDVPTVDWATVTKVCDLACGTGISTRFLAQTVPRVTIDAVEPVEKMRDVLAAQAIPGVTVREGTSVAIPAEDETYDMVFVGQAFHWFASKESLAEMHRVLRKGGIVVLAWNMECKKTAWVAEMRSLYEAFDGDVPQYRKGEWIKAWEGDVLFEPLQRKFIEHVQVKTRGSLIKMVGTKSYIARQSDETRDVLFQQIHAILDKTFGQGDDDQEIPLPYTTEVAFARKKGTINLE